MSKKLVIKINNLQAIDEDELAKKHEVEEFLWGRIVSFAAVVVILLFGGIWFFVGGTGTKITPTTENAAAEISNTEEFEALDEISQPTASGMVEDPIAETALSSADDNAADVERADAEAPEESTRPAKENTIIAVADPVKSAEDIREVEPKAAPAQSERVVEPLKPAEIQLLAKGIAQAQLTSSLTREKQPTNELGYKVSMNGENLIRVYLYTQLEGISGKTLYHSWFRNGDRMARVRIPVISDSYRASSSKFIDRLMLGEWQVNIADENGTKYAQVNFSVSE